VEHVVKGVEGKGRSSMVMLMSLQNGTWESSEK
jgi:hypothetical protein